MPRRLVEHRPQHGRVAGTIVGHSDQRLDDAAALHFVVVLANHPLLAANVERAEDLEKCSGEYLARRFFEASPAST